MEMTDRDGMNAVARQFVSAPVDYSFTAREMQALAPFFSNSHRKIFFMSGLPESVAATLLAMYSRLKNPRGLRGHFVDHLVPILMLGGSEESPKGQEAEWKLFQKEFRHRGLRTLDAICDSDVIWARDFKAFVSAAANPVFWRRIADSKRIRDFKSEHLDKYGHNSIARPARLLMCAEGVSIMAAKAFEETWPGTAFIELSTRYVDFSKKSQYPVWDEIALVDRNAAHSVRLAIDRHIASYQQLMGENFDGPFPSELREQFVTLVTDENDLKNGIIGESCDVLGNLLPCSTLTEVGIAVSGEALGQLIKNLHLQGTSECTALAELVVDETEKSGNSYFLRHHEPTPWEVAGAVCLPPTHNRIYDTPHRMQTMFRILAAFGNNTNGGENTEDRFKPLLAELECTDRGEFDKLPLQFRVVSALFQDVMSYRGWRDLQRMSLSVHFRSRVTPVLGFYRYPKMHSPILDEAFIKASEQDSELYSMMARLFVPEALAEYPMAMGNLVTYQMTSDLRQAEFCGWQRTKWGVNDEVRQAFLSIEFALRRQFPWWQKLSRADVTPHYVFARGNKSVVLPQE